MSDHNKPGPRVLLLSAVGTSVNPYLGLLREGLVSAGAEVALASNLNQVDWGPERCPDVIHLHWLDYYDIPKGILASSLHGRRDLLSRAARRSYETLGNLVPVYQFRRWRRLREFLQRLRTFQQSGGSLAYTIHNLEPHDEQGIADHWAAGELIRQADLLHVHDASTADAVGERWGRHTGIVTIPHGHYLNCYPNSVTTSDARAKLGLPDGAFIYLSLGMLRPYKGLEELLPAFRSLPDADVRLVLAGKPRDMRFADTLARLSGQDPRILLVPEFVPPNEIQLYMNASDICVLPYRQVTTSGAALLAFSFGLPVIAPAAGAFPHLVVGRRGLLYRPDSPTGLRDALVEARQTSWLDLRGETLAWVAQFEWGVIGSRLLKAYGVQPSSGA